MATLIALSLLLVGCGGGASSSHPSRYSTRQAERVFASVGLKLRPEEDFGSDLPCPFLRLVRKQLFVIVSMCGDQGETDGVQLPLPRLFRRGNVLVRYDMQVSPGIAARAKALTKIKEALSLLPGSQPVAAVHLHVARSPSFTPFSTQEVVHTFKDAGVPLRAVPVNRSAFLRVLFGGSHGGPYDLRFLVPRKEFEAAVQLGGHDHLLIIVSSRVSAASPLLVDEGSVQDLPEEQQGDGFFFNVYYTWQLRLPVRENVRAAIKRLEQIADARLAIAAGT